HGLQTRRSLMPRLIGSSKPIEKDFELGISNSRYGHRISLQKIKKLDLSKFGVSPSNSKFPIQIFPQTFTVVPSNHVSVKPENSSLRQGFSSWRYRIATSSPNFSDSTASERQ